MNLPIKKSRTHEMFVHQLGLSTELVVACPKCGYDYSAPMEVFTRKGYDEFEAVDYSAPPDPTPKAPEFRRSGIVLRFEGECGHFFNLVIQQHKGITYIWGEELSESEAHQGMRSKEAGERNDPS